MPLQRDNEDTFRAWLLRNSINFTALRGLLKFHFTCASLSTLFDIARWYLNADFEFSFQFYSLSESSLDVSFILRQSSPLLASKVRRPNHLQKLYMQFAKNYIDNLRKIALFQSSFHTSVPVLSVKLQVEIERYWPDTPSKASTCTYNYAWWVFSSWICLKPNFIMKRTLFTIPCHSYSKNQHFFSYATN